jgi:hypothetical protein
VGELGPDHPRHLADVVQLDRLGELDLDQVALTTRRE